MKTRALHNILVTGGAGFIGSNFIRYLLEQPTFTGRVINVDLLTYAGNLANLSDIEARPRYVFERADIRDRGDLQELFSRFEIDTVVHFAAESHVDRSIASPSDFITTNIGGTFNLLESARTSWTGRGDTLFHHVSTDEVYGSLGETGSFSETTPYDPRSPYSASKASSDHLVRAYAHTYALPITISNCSNNYGPYQFPEKLVPLMILNMLEGKPLPVYGDGSNVRDWLHVRDHASAVWTILRHGQLGETWNVGGENEWKNIELVRALCSLVAEMTGQQADTLEKLITFVADRPGHDQRYAIDCDKIKSELEWAPAFDFRAGLRDTVSWYLANMPWVDSIRSGAYQEWIELNYGARDEE